jgi:biotin carboxylase
MGRPYVRAAHRLGLAVTVLDFPRRLEAARRAGLFAPEDELVPMVGMADELWYAAAVRAAQPGISGIVAFTEPHVVPAALVAQELSLPGPGLHAAVVSRNKPLQRALFAAAGLPQPEFGLFDSLDVAEVWAAKRLPLVAKPPSNAGSDGVEMIGSPARLRRWVAKNPSPFLLEQYLASDEVSCEALVRDGRTVFSNVTRKVTSGIPYFVELQHWVPADLPPEVTEAVLDICRRVVAAMRIGSGLVHLELKLEPDGPTVLEVAVRTPGDHILELIHLACGVDLFEGLIATACQLTWDPDARREKHALAWFPTFPAGTVTRSRGTRKLARDASVAASYLRLQPGTSIRQLRSSLDRVGAVLFVADDRESLSMALARAQRQLVVQTRPS